jgi:choline transport protein
MPLIAYTGAQQVIALIATCEVNYTIQGWHGALLTIAFVVFGWFALVTTKDLDGWLKTRSHSVQHVRHQQDASHRGPGCHYPSVRQTKVDLRVQKKLRTFHSFGFAAFVVIFWVLGPREPASVVFTQFQDQNGWGSYGLAVSRFPINVYYS